jgi:hypothetical protein
VPQLAWGLAAAAPVVLAVGLVLRTEAIGVSVALAGANYLLFLELDGRGLDPGAPLVAGGVALAAELAFWSLALAGPVPLAPGEAWRRAFDALAIALGSAAAALIALAAGGAGSGGGLPLELLATAAAVASLAVLAALAAPARAVDSR